MDSITQIALGASIAAAVGGKSHGKKAALLGAVLGTLPDLDVLIPYGSAIADMTQHRGFSHSLFVLAAFSGLLWLLWHGWRPAPTKAESRTRFAMIALPLMTHPLLDGFTTYGTQWFWPLQPPPVAISSIFIIDPMYTLPMLIGLGFFLFRRQPKVRPVTWGLLLSSAYLAWTLIAQAWVTNFAEQQWRQAGLLPDLDTPVLVTPTPFNSLYWRVLLLEKEQYHEGLVRAFSKQDIHWQSRSRNPELAEVVADHPELPRLHWFTKNRLGYRTTAEGQLAVVDYRLGSWGYFPFQFALAQHDDNGWQSLPVSERVTPDSPPNFRDLLKGLP